MNHRACRKATQLLSEAMERELTRSERLWVWCHLSLCRSCRRYGRQVRFLRRAVRVIPVTEAATS
jgi:hypothetical protein